MEYTKVRLNDSTAHGYLVVRHAEDDQVLVRLVVNAALHRLQHVSVAEPHCPRQHVESQQQKGSGEGPVATALTVLKPRQDLMLIVEAEGHLAVAGVGILEREKGMVLGRPKRGPLARAFM